MSPRQLTAPAEPPGADAGDALPLRPSGGNRRGLDERWLARLESGPVPVAPARRHDPPPPELHRAIAEFNCGAYWECHETLEDVWRESPYPLRFFYHAVIKVAVGFHHLGRRNRHGTRTKLADGARLLALFQPDLMGVRNDRLLDDVNGWLARVDGPGRPDWAALDSLARPSIHVTE